jgi:hypothetical protein
VVEQLISFRIVRVLLQHLAQNCLGFVFPAKLGLKWWLGCKQRLDRVDQPSPRTAMDQWPPAAGRWHFGATLDHTKPARNADQFEPRFEFLAHPRHVSLLVQSQPRLKSSRCPFGDCRSRSYYQRYERLCGPQKLGIQQRWPARDKVKDNA